MEKGEGNEEVEYIWVFWLSQYLESATVFIGVGSWEPKLPVACKIVPHKRIILFKMLILMPRKYFLELFFIFELKKLNYVSVPIF